MTAYVDGEARPVDIFYNGYISPLTQEVRRETLLPLQQATHPRGDEDEDEEDDGAPRRWSSTSPTPRRSCTG